MVSTVYRVTQKDFYARPYMRMRDLRHNIDNDDLELITPHMLINTWQELEYRLDICRATRWFKYDRDSFVCKSGDISPGHI